MFLFVSGDFAARRETTLDETFEFCGDMDAIVNNTIEFEGPFVATCDHDVITFWPVFHHVFLASLAALLLFMCGVSVVCGDRDAAATYIV